MGIKDNKYLKISLYAFGVIAAAMVLFAIAMHLGTVLAGIEFFFNLLSPFIWGFAIAYILNYPYKAFLRLFSFRTKKGRTMPRKPKKALSLLLTYTVFIAIAISFFYLVVPHIVTAIAEFVEILPQYFEKVSKWAEGFTSKYLERFGISYEQVSDAASKMGKQISNDFNYNDVLTAVLSWILSASAGIKNVFLGLIVSVYFLADKERFIRSFKRLTYAVLPEPKGDKLVDIMRFADKTFGGFLIAKIVDSVIIGTLNYIFMLIMDMEYAVLISVIVGVTNIIPFFGPFIGGIPSVFIMMIADPWDALILGIFLVVLQQFDGNFLGPKLMGDTMGIRAVFVVFSVIVFGGLFGIVGMFIGVPLFVVIYTLFAQAITAKLKKKDIKIK